MSVQSDVKKALDALGALGVDSSGTGWIRFANGTQIAYGLTAMTWNSFPVAFSEKPTVLLTPRLSSNSIQSAWLDDDSVNNTKFFPRVTNNGLIYYIAIGRWK